MHVSAAKATLLSDLFIERVRLSPKGRAFRQFDGRQWQDHSWAQAAHEVGRWRAALRRDGLKAGDRVAVAMRNRFEWAVFEQAALGLGLVVVPLFYNDRADNMAYCLNDSGTRLLLIEDPALWPPLRGQLETVERVVCLADVAADGALVARRNWLPGVGEPLDRGPAQPDDLATLVYTSGTTGKPKGVMLSHRNVVSNAFASVQSCSFLNDKDRFLSFLPLSHMFERTAAYYFALIVGAETVYARGIPELGEDMLSQRPTVFICVPRIFERIYMRMQEGLPAGSFKRKIFETAVDVGWRRFNRQATPGDRLLWPLLWLLVARKLHKRLGGRVRLIVSGAAALAPHLARVFLGLGLPIIQGYGLTEFSPVISVNRISDNDPASVGRPLEGVEIRTTAEGELLARGPEVMLGYWRNAAATSAIIDADGWLHTGDVVAIRDGRIYITGRAKDIIVLSNGENVPPGDVEQAIMTDPTFDQVMVIGEGRGHLGLLAVSRLENETELCRRANEQLRAFPGYVRIHHLARILDPFTVENGLLTPTLKMRRTQIEQRYAREIESMYRRESRCRPPQG